MIQQFYLYSATTNSFYPVSAPADSIQITEEQHTALFDGQSEGKAIKPNKAGYPINVKQGKSYEAWDQKSESWVTDQKLYEKYLEEEKQRRLQQLQFDLDDIEKRITRIERIKDRTEDEEKELQKLYDESTDMFRKIEEMKKEA